MEGGFLTGWQCVACGVEYPVEPLRYRCDTCGGNLDALYDYFSIASRWRRDSLASDRDRSLWRYLPLLPVAEGPSRRSIQVGGTPLVRLERLAADLHLNELYIKDDTRNPSLSLKDRASEVGIRHAVENGHSTIVVASTGNAAASLATLGAWHGVRAVVLAPASAPEAKLAQMLQCGAQVCTVQGSYDDAFDLSLQVAGEYGWYLRSTGVNPVMSEGKKTVAFELVEQLGWEVPDRIYVPVGDGCILGGVHKGLHDLLSIGWISRMPKLIAVQAEGSAAVVKAFRGNGEIQPVDANTVADSISVDFPRDGAKALRALRESGGAGVLVRDPEILAAQHLLALETGLFAEPAAAAAFAGLLKDVEAGKVGEKERVAVLITGSGLKDIPAARRILELPEPVAASMEGFGTFLKRVGETR